MSKVDIIEHLRISASQDDGFTPYSPNASELNAAADEIERLRAERDALLKDDALLALKLAVDDTRLRAEKAESERDALREYYEAVQTHPVNYSAGNIERVMAAIKAIKDIDAALGGKGPNEYLRQKLEGD